MRPVILDDADVLLAWRNDPETRTASLNTDPVERASHVEWLMRTIEDSTRELYIGEREGTAIGTVRFDVESAVVSEVSITVAPAQRGRRFALPLLQAGLAAHAANASSESTVYARIREENAASRALFCAAGFHVIGSDGGVLLLARGKRSISSEGPS